MHITKIAARNFKGRQICQDLSMLTEITGKNFTGKTAHLDAIRLALIGHIPEIGKKNDATFELSSGSRMVVIAEMSDGTTVEREFWRDGESIKSAGPEKSLCPALMDAAEYFSLTDTQRLDYIAARMELPSGFKASDILTDLSAKLKESPSEVMIELIAAIQDEFEGISVSEAITALTEKGGVLPCAYTKWNAKAKDTIGHVRTLALLKSREEECSAETLETLGEEFKRLNLELETAQKRQGELAGQAMRVNNQKMRRAELKEIVNTPTSTPKPLPEAPKMGEKEMAVYQTEITRLDAELAKLPAADREIGQLLTVSMQRLGQLVQVRDGLDSQLSELNVEIDAVGASTCCPTCKSKPKDLKKRLTASLVIERDDVQAKYTEADRVLAEHKRAAGLLERRSELGRAGEVDRAKYLEEKRLNQTQYWTIKQDMEAHVSQVQRIEQQNTSAKTLHKQQIDTAWNELSAMDAQEPVDEQALTGVAATVARLKLELGSIMNQRETAVALQQDLKRAAEAAEEHQTAKAYVEAITVAGKFLKERQAESIATLFTTLLAKANRYVQGILRAPLAFHGDEVGMFEASGSFTTHRTMSGTEKALTYIAVAAALSEQGTVRVLILDEMGRLDRDNRENVMIRLKHAVEEGWIDQAILIDTEPTLVDGWQQIAL